MKKLVKRSLVLTFAAVMALSVFCSAAPLEDLPSLQSSRYFDGYCAHCTAVKGGKIIVSVQVDALGYMSKIGASKIYIYKSSDNAYFSCVKTYKYADYPSMMSSGTHFNDDVITFHGTPKYYYRAAVFCYAGNSSGHDQEYYLTSSVRAIT